MIISSLSDDKILEELLFDKKIVAKEAKKIARKQIIRLQKGGVMALMKILILLMTLESDNLIISGV